MRDVKKIHDDIIRIRKEHYDGMRFYADLINEVYSAEENSILSDELMTENCDILSSLKNYASPEDTGKLINVCERVDYATRNPVNMDVIETSITLIDRDGNYRPSALTLYLDFDEKDLLAAYVGIIRPYTKREIQEQKILRSFSNDKNPAIFIDRIAEFMANNPERMYAFIQFDVRKFRYINEKYGSKIGDEVLDYIRETLNIMCDETHLFARLTADLFQVVTYYNNREEILEFIDMIDLRLHRYKDVRFSMSYGVSIAPGTSTEYRKHGDEAGLARVECKGAILKKAVFYEDTLMLNLTKTGAIEEIEEDALRNGEFHVFLQPKYEYDGSDAEIIGAEALVRWIDSEGHMKSPMEFVPVFEQNGFILEVDKFMWEEVCKILKRWRDEGKPLIPISVNVSRTYLRKINIVTYLDSLIDKYDIPVEYLQLEITETTESEETIEYANAFKKAGYTLLMDDFGSGYSSLGSLKNTPFDILKMDRSFLTSCLDSDNGKAIVSHVISMSNDLGLDIVAEGVETKEVADFLYNKGCTVSQGYYFSKPVPVADFEEKLFGVNS